MYKSLFWTDENVTLRVKVLFELTNAIFNGGCDPVVNCQTIKIDVLWQGGWEALEGVKNFEKFLTSFMNGRPMCTVYTGIGLKKWLISVRKKNRLERRDPGHWSYAAGFLSILFCLGAKLLASVANNLKYGMAIIGGQG